MVQSKGRLSHSPDTTLISLATPWFFNESEMCWFAHMVMFCPSMTGMNNESASARTRSSSRVDCWS